MAGGSLLLLLDDISILMDDVSVMTKIAAKKTAGLVGDDLALNAEQVTGVKPNRELPVIWAVAKGSSVNKLILVPAALLISYFIKISTIPVLLNVIIRPPFKLSIQHKNTSIMINWNNRHFCGKNSFYGSVIRSSIS